MIITKGIIVLKLVNEIGNRGQDYFPLTSDINNWWGGLFFTLPIFYIFFIT